MRPNRVMCASCNEEAPAHTATEYVLCRSLTNSGKGTMTNARGIRRLGVYVCQDCERDEGPLMPAELVAPIVESCRAMARRRRGGGLFAS